MSSSLGIPIKQEKTFYPTTRLELHGILFDTDEMLIKVPDDKLITALAQIDFLLSKKKATLKEIQSICGTLQFLVRAVPSGRCFLRRLYDLTQGLTFPNQHVRLNSQSKKDLVTWKTFLQNFNGSNIIAKINWSTDSQWNFYSDACGTAYASIYGHKWLQGKFPTHWIDKSIAIKEMVPIYIAFLMW
ncbi:MAG: hypothetical protein GY705_29160, partial [Bacteroidetes bacterium]|nr:hypothetical protein [Bacteroidota bacterium]